MPSSVHTQQVGPFPQTTTPGDIINFRLGQPSPSLLPLDAVARAARDQLAGDPLMLQYGHPAGYEGFRVSLARFLSDGYGHPVPPEQLAVTSGTSLALALVSQILAGGGETVICGDPTYFLAEGIFTTHRLRVVGVPVDSAGLDVDALGVLLRRGLKPRFVYCIPSFHNPCGVCLQPERARRLVDLAEAHDFVIVADEPYNLLHFGTRPTCMMAYDDGRGRVLSLGTFSKILAPGVRLGWIHAAPSLLRRYLDHGSLQSGGCLNPVMARIVHGTLDSGFLGDHVAHLRGVLSSRARALGEALSAVGMKADVPGGGYFTWVDLGPNADTTALLERCQETYAVSFCPGDRCGVERDLRRYLRLSFAFYDEAELAMGVERLASARAEPSGRPRSARPPCP